MDNVDLVEVDGEGGSEAGFQDAAAKSGYWFWSCKAPYVACGIGSPYASLPR